ncbi:MAG: cobalamin biosynthesis protein [Tannerellaceae bacterium]|jgi:hypothetical protein|nr:cobalamin biosynthesis protein [Tannerellaceae bacterium]
MRKILLLHVEVSFRLIPVIGGWMADRLVGDPEGWPRPVALFGKIIGAGERAFERRRRGRDARGIAADSPQRAQRARTCSGKPGPPCGGRALIKLRIEN